MYAVRILHAEQPEDRARMDRRLISYQGGDMLCIQRYELRLVVWQGVQYSRRSPSLPQPVCSTGALTISEMCHDCLVPCAGTRETPIQCGKSIRLVWSKCKVWGLQDTCRRLIIFRCSNCVTRIQSARTESWSERLPASSSEWHYQCHCQRDLCVRPLATWLLLQPHTKYT